MITKLRQLCALALCGILLAGNTIAVQYGDELNPTTKEYVQTFSDVPADNWAFQYIAELVERGAISGYPDGNFRPTRIVTREEFAKIMVVAANLSVTSTTVSSYADVSTTYWASPFIETAKPYLTAYQNSNGSLLFKPTDGALREDIAVAVVMLKGYDTRLADLSMLSAMFSDVDAISESARPYVALAVENGLVSGYTDGTFRAQATITRSEAAAILWRAFQYGSDTKVIGAGESIAPTNSTAPVSTPKPSVSVNPPSETPTPTASEPPKEVKKNYKLTTIANGPAGVPIMIIKNDSSVYYLDGSTVHNCANNSSLDLRNDLTYPITSDEKNRKFGVYGAAILAYDSSTDTVYLIGNDADNLLVIYNITDFSNPTMLLSRDNFEQISSDRIKCNAITDNVQQLGILGNGQLVLRLSSMSETSVFCYAVDRKNQTISRLPDKYGYLVTADKVYDPRYNTDSLDIYDTASATSSTVSIEGKFPGNYTGNVFAKEDGLYFWENSTGLVHVDSEGWRHIIIPQEQIAVEDYKGFPYDVRKLVLSKDGSCALYDLQSKTIRMIAKSN